jgi:uncharacterized membrane protein
MEELVTGGIKLEAIENYHQYESIIRDMLCCVCLNVVCKPVECVICSTLICDDCFQILLIAGKKCMTPNCKGNLRKANKFVREILSNLRISCIYCYKEGLSYPDYISHLDKCTPYQASEQFKLLKTIKEKEEKINELNKEVENSKKTTLNLNNLSIRTKDPYAHLSKEALRNQLITFNLPVNQKMELYNACVEGRIEDFKNFVLNKNFPILEEVSAHNYFWTPFHYAMHYGQWEVIKFICEYLKKFNIFESALRLESNDNRCPLLCLLRSNSLNLDKKTAIFSNFLSVYPYVPLSNDVRKEIKSRGLENIVKKYHKG